MSMKIAHTPTRLTVRANGDANSYALLDDKGNWFMSIQMSGEQMQEKQEANLQRLVDCWNACEVPPPSEPSKCPGVKNSACGWSSTTGAGDTCRVCGEILPF